MTDLERSCDQPGATIATQVYVRGPGWPTATVSDAPVNPWTRGNWNITNQGRIYRRDQAEANRLAQTAGHRDALSSRRENAK